jgi:hypothetical protein
MFDCLRKAQVARGESIWGAFLDEGDWEFARWILESGTTHASINELLDLKKVSKCVIDGVEDLRRRRRFKRAFVPHSTTADLSFKRLTPFQQGRNGLVNFL